MAGPFVKEVELSKTKSGGGTLSTGETFTVENDSVVYIEEFQVMIDSVIDAGSFKNANMTASGSLTIGQREAQAPAREFSAQADQNVFRANGDKENTNAQSVTLTFARNAGVYVYEGETMEVLLTATEDSGVDLSAGLLGVIRGRRIL